MDSGNEIGPFRAIEESSLAHLTPAANRSDIYAWYSLIGTAGQALGMMLSGWAMHYMRVEIGWGSIQVYRAVFWGYAALGLIKLCFTLGLSKAVEADRKTTPPQDAETAPLLADGNVNEVTKPKKSTFRSLLPEISADSKIIVVNLCLLFAIDSFASGVASL
jgi:MFS family permease